MKNQEEKKEEKKEEEEEKKEKERTLIFTEQTNKRSINKKPQEIGSEFASPI